MALLGNPAAPVDVARRVFATGSLLPAGSRLKNVELSPAATAALVAHPDPKIRMQVAENQRLPRNILGRLASDPDSAVRARFALMAWRNDTQPSPEALAVMSVDPDPEIRGAAGRLLGSRDEARLRLVEDPEPDVRAAAVSSRHVWSMLSLEARERLLADPDPRVARAVGVYRHAGTPLPTTLAGFAAESSLKRRESVVIKGRLDRDLAEHLVRDPDVAVRARVAGNEHLPVDLAVLLGRDHDPTVRLAASMHGGLSEEQRAAIDYIVPEGRAPIARWVRAEQDDPDAMRRAAASAHVLLRRSAANMRRLPPDVVEILARDEDYYVRLMLCHHCADAPHELLVDMYAHDDHLEWEMLRFKPNFARPGLARFVDHANARLRRVALLDPEAGPDVVERLSRDSDFQVRYEAAGDPRLPPGRLLELLYDEDVASAAAGNGSLPVDCMHRLLDAAGAPRV